jgi:hypothetical protein
VAARDRCHRGRERGDAAGDAQPGNLLAPLQVATHWCGRTLGLEGLALDE